MNEPANAPHARAADLTIPHDAQVTAVPKNTYPVHWFEIICCDCGGQPGLGYREVSPELQRIRGPYPIAASVTAYQKHIRRHQNRRRFISQATRTRDVNAN